LNDPPEREAEASDENAHLPRTQRGHARRTRIMNAAIRLMWRDGYDAVGIDTILKEAGTQKGSFYHFFPSKIDLLLACLDHLWSVQRQRLGGILASAPSGRAALSMHLIYLCETQRTAFRRYGYVPGLFHMSIGVTVVHLDERVADKITTFSNEHVALLRESLERIATEEGVAIEPEKLANMMGSLITGSILRARFSNDIDYILTLPNNIDEMLEHFSYTH